VGDRLDRDGWADNFSGGIDEVAIYDPPLTPARIWAHFHLGKNGRSGLTITRLAALPRSVGRPERCSTPMPSPDHGQTWSAPSRQAQRHTIPGWTDPKVLPRETVADALFGGLHLRTALEAGRKLPASFFTGSVPHRCNRMKTPYHSCLFLSSAAASQARRRSGSLARGT